MTIKSIVTPFMLELIPVFDGLDESGYGRLAEITRRRPYSIGEMIIWEGEQPNEVYFIKEGRVEVIVRAEGFVDLGPGDSFGEASLLENGEFLTAGRRKPRNACVVARTNVDLIYIFADDLGKLLGDYPPVKKQFAELAALRSHPH